MMKRSELQKLLLEKIPNLSKGSALYLSRVGGIEGLLEKKELPPNPNIRPIFRHYGGRSERWYRKRMIDYLEPWIIIEDKTFTKTTYEALADYCEKMSRG